LNLRCAAGHRYGDVRGNPQVGDAEDVQAFLDPAVVAVDEALCGGVFPGSGMTSLLFGSLRAS